MARFNEKTDITSEQLQAFGKRLRAVAKFTDSLADSMGAMGVEFITPTNVKSGHMAITKMRAFLKGLQDGIGATLTDCLPPLDLESESAETASSEAKSKGTPRQIPKKKKPE